MQHRLDAQPVFLIGCLILSLSGCSDSPTSPMVDSGSWYETGFRWPHDGHPFETEHFVVYSDGASLEARSTLAQIGEGVIETLKTEFGVTSDTLFRFPPGRNNRIHIYAYRYQNPQSWGGQSYNGGLLIYSLDHEQRSEAGYTELGSYTRVVKHELVHVIQFLIAGPWQTSHVDEWFSEGLAEYISGGASAPPITSRSRFESLTAAHGEFNPVSVHFDFVYQDPQIGADYYYPMYGLAVAYLLEPGGAGRAKTLVTDLFLDIRDGATFADSFRDRFLMTLLDYEAQFFNLIRAYLK